MSKKAARLAEQFQPENYQLELDLNKDALTFHGTVIISGQKLKPSQRLTFHQNGLTVTAAQITKHDKKGEQRLVPERVNHHKSLQEVRLHTKQTLYPGRYTVKLRFKGKITESMVGIYPSVFKHKGKQQTILVTQFESHHAREAFPCIDEPAAKATFDLSLITDKGETVISNMPALKQSAKKDRLLTVFEQTPKMSTYLLALVVGQLHNVEAKTRSGVTVRSWCSVAQPKSHLKYGVQEAAKILDFFEDYFGVPFPLQKCDQVALPDFDAGAMENWGLVTYREIAHLIDPANRSISNEQYVSLVIAHELSHQWFGNLVTMKWWDDLWLNESFAALMEHVALDALHPDWQQWEFYTASDVISTTSRDVYSDIQPVGIKVDDPDLLHTLFDPGIVYAKGARLLKMVREHIGDQAFQDGLKTYFKKHAYGNTSRDDLWAAWSEVTGQDVGALVTPWLVKPGMPIVHVKQTGQKVQVSQEHFMLDKPADDFLWPIALLADPPLQPAIFDTPKAELKAASNQYVIINALASGHYFTDYQTTAHRAFIVKRYHDQKLPTEARINLLNDSYMLARHGDSSLTTALDLAAASNNEPRNNVWAMVFRTLGAANQLTEGSKVAEQQLKSLRLKLGRQQHKQLGWDDKPTDDPNTKQLRHSMVSLMVGGEDPAAIKEALRRYKATDDLHKIDAELRNTVLYAAVLHGPKDTVDNLLGAYDQSSAEVQLDIASALAGTRDPKVAEHILSKALGTTGFVRPQDTLRWLVIFLRNHHIRTVVWDYMLTNWEWMEKTLQNSKSFDFLPTYCASVVSTKDWAKKYRDVFEPRLKIKSMERNIKIGLSDIEARVAWRQRDEAKIKQWLSKNTK